MAKKKYTIKNWNDDKSDYLNLTPGRHKDSEERLKASLTKEKEKEASKPAPKDLTEPKDAAESKELTESRKLTGPLKDPTQNATGLNKALLQQEEKLKGNIVTPVEAKPAKVHALEFAQDTQNMALDLLFNVEGDKIMAAKEKEAKLKAKNTVEAQLRHQMPEGDYEAHKAAKAEYEKLREKTYAWKREYIHNDMNEGDIYSISDEDNWLKKAAKGTWNSFMKARNAAGSFFGAATWEAFESGFTPEEDKRFKELEASIGKIEKPILKDQRKAIQEEFDMFMAANGLNGTDSRETYDKSKKRLEESGTNLNESFGTFTSTLHNTRDIIKNYEKVLEEYDAAIENRGVWKGLTSESLPMVNLPSKIRLAAIESKLKAEGEEALDPLEKTLLNSALLRQRVESSPLGHSGGYMLGKGVNQSIGFMADLAIANRILPGGSGFAPGTMAARAVSLSKDLAKPLLMSSTWNTALDESRSAQAYTDAEGNQRYVASDSQKRSAAQSLRRNLNTVDSTINQLNEKIKEGIELTDAEQNKLESATNERNSIVSDLSELVDKDGNLVNPETSFLEGGAKGYTRNLTEVFAEKYVGAIWDKYVPSLGNVLARTKVGNIKVGKKFNVADIGEKVSKTYTNLKDKGENILFNTTKLGGLSKQLYSHVGPSKMIHSLPAEMVEEVAVQLTPQMGEDYATQLNELTSLDFYIQVGLSALMIGGGSASIGAVNHFKKMATDKDYKEAYKSKEAKLKGLKAQYKAIDDSLTDESFAQAVAMRVPGSIFQVEDYKAKIAALRDPEAKSELGLDKKGKRERANSLEQTAFKNMALQAVQTGTSTEFIKSMEKFASLEGVHEDTKANIPLAIARAKELLEVKETHSEWINSNTIFDLETRKILAEDSIEDVNSFIESNRQSITVAINRFNKGLNEDSKLNADQIIEAAKNGTISEMENLQTVLEASKSKYIHSLLDLGKVNEDFQASLTELEDSIEFETNPANYKEINAREQGKIFKAKVKDVTSENIAEVKESLKDNPNVTPAVVAEINEKAVEDVAVVSEDEVDFEDTMQLSEEEAELFNQAHASLPKVEVNLENLDTSNDPNAQIDSSGNTVQTPSNTGVQNTEVERINKERDEKLKSHNITSLESRILNLENTLEREIKANKSTQITNSTKDNIKITKSLLKSAIDKIHAEYDAKIDALEKQPNTNNKSEIEAKKAEIKGKIKELENQKEEVVSRKTELSDEEINNIFEKVLSGAIRIKNLNWTDFKFEAIEELTKEAEKNKKLFKKAVAPTEAQIKERAFEIFKRNLKSATNDGSSFVWTIHDGLNGFGTKFSSENIHEHGSKVDTWHDMRHERGDKETIFFDEMYSTKGYRSVEIRIPVTDQSGGIRSTDYAGIQIALPDGITAEEVALPIIKEAQKIVDEADIYNNQSTTEQMRDLAIPMAEKIINEKLGKVNQKVDSTKEINKLKEELKELESKGNVAQTPSELQSEIDKINERRKEDLAKLDTLKKEVGDAFSGHSSTNDLLTAIGKFFVTNFGWKFGGNREYSIYVSKERNRTEFDINGLEVNLPEGATVGVMGGSHYARFTPQEIIDAKYDAELAALESKTTTSSGKGVQNTGEITLEEDYNQYAMSTADVSDANVANVIDNLASFVSEAKVNHPAMTFNSFIGSVMDPNVLGPDRTREMFDVLRKSWEKGSNEVISDARTEQLYNSLFLSDVAAVKLKAILNNNTTNSDRGTIAEQPVPDVVTPKELEDTDNAGTTTTEVGTFDPGTQNTSVVKEATPETKKRFHGIGMKLGGVLGLDYERDDTTGEYSDVTDEVNSTAKAFMDYRNFKPGEDVEVVLYPEHILDNDGNNPVSKWTNLESELPTKTVVTFKERTIEIFRDSLSLGTANGVRLSDDQIWNNIKDALEEYASEKNSDNILFQGEAGLEFLKMIPTGVPNKGYSPSSDPVLLGGLNDYNWWNNGNVVLFRNKNNPEEVLYKEREDRLAKNKFLNLEARKKMLANSGSMTVTVSSNEDATNNIREDKEAFHSIMSNFDSMEDFNNNATIAVFNNGDVVYHEDKGVKQYAKVGGTVINNPSVQITNWSSVIGQLDSSNSNGPKKFTNGRILLLVKVGDNKFTAHNVINNHQNKLEEFARIDSDKVALIANSILPKWEQSGRSKDVEKVQEWFVSKGLPRLTSKNVFAFAANYPSKFEGNHKQDFKYKVAGSVGPHAKAFATGKGTLVPDLRDYNTIDEFLSDILTDKEIPMIDNRELLLSNIHTNLKFTKIENGGEAVYTYNSQPKIIFEVKDKAEVETAYRDLAAKEGKEEIASLKETISGLETMKEKFKDNPASVANLQKNIDKLNAQIATLESKISVSSGNEVQTTSDIETDVEKRFAKNGGFSIKSLVDSVPNSEVVFEDSSENESDNVTTVTLRDKTTKKHIASINIAGAIDGYYGVRIQVNSEFQGKGLSKHLYNLALTEVLQTKKGKGLYTVDEMLKTPDKTKSTRDNFVTAKNTDTKFESKIRARFTNVANPTITFIEDVSDKFVIKGATKINTKNDAEEVSVEDDFQNTFGAINDVISEVVSRVIEKHSLDSEIKVTTLLKNSEIELDNLIEEFKAKGKDRHVDFIQENREQILGDSSMREGSVLEYFSVILDTQELDSYLDSVGENVKENYDANSFEIDGTSTLSGKIRLIFSNIKDTTRQPGFGGLQPSMSTMDVLDSIHQILSETSDSSLKEVLKVIDNMVTRNPVELAFFNSVADKLVKLEKESPELLNQLLYNLSQPKTQMKFIMWSNNNNGIRLSSYNANVNDPLFKKRNQWTENLKGSPLVELYEQDYFRINENVLEKLEELYDKVFNRYNSTATNNIENITKKDLQEFLEYFGITLNPVTLATIFRENDGSVFKDMPVDFKLEERLLRGENSIVGQLMRNLDTALELSDKGNKLSFGNVDDAVSMNMLLHRNSQVLDLINTDNFTEFHPMGVMRIAGKNIYMYQQPNNILNRINNLKQSIKDYINDPESLKGVLKELRETAITSESFLLDLVEENPAEALKTLDTFMISLEAIKEASSKSRDDMGVTGLSDKDSFLTTFGMYADSEGTFSKAVDSKFDDEIALRKGYMNFPTISDSSQLPFMKTVMLDIQNEQVTSGKISPAVMKIIIDKLVLSELKRVEDYLTKGGLDSNIDGYDAGAIWITSIPALNTTEIELASNDLENTEGIKRPLIDVFRKGVANGISAEDFVKKNIAVISESINDFFNAQADVYYNANDNSGLFFKNGLIETQESGAGVLLIKAPATKGKLPRTVAMDYVINYFIQQKEIQNLFAGDLAQYFKNKMVTDKVINGEKVRELKHGLPKVSAEDVFQYHYGTEENFARLSNIIGDNNLSEIKGSQLATVLAEFPELAFADEFITLEVDANHEAAYQRLLPVASMKLINMFKDVQNNLSKRLKGQISPGNRYVSFKTENDYIQVMVEDVENSSETIGYLIASNPEYSHLIDDKDFMKDLKDFKALDEIYNKSGEVKSRHKKLYNSISKRIPNISAYLKTASTDAQEYSSWQENLNQLKSQGRISEVQRKSIEDKLNAQAKDLKEKGKISDSNKLSLEEMQIALMQPTKPLYAGLVNTTVGDGHKVSRFVYVKSSSFPLIPELAEKFPKLEAIRKNIDKIQEMNPGKMVRISYQSANKVGAVKTPVNISDLHKSVADFNGDENAYNSFINNVINQSSVVLSRENFYIQQDKPFKSDKNAKAGKPDRTTRATQFEKIILGDGINRLGHVFASNMFDPVLLEEVPVSLEEVGIKPVNGKISGPDLKAIYNHLYAKEQAIKVNKFLGKMKMVDYSDIAEGKIETMEQIAKLFNKRLNNKQDKKAMELLYMVKTQVGDKTFKEEFLTKEELTERAARGIEETPIRAMFRLPLHMTPNSNKMESVAASMISKSNINLELPGYSFPVASQEGFDFRGIENKTSSPSEIIDVLLSTNKITKTDC